MLFLLYMNYVYISKDLGRNWQEPRTDIFRAIRIIFYLGYYLSMLWWPSFCGPSWTICRLETYQLHLVVLFIYCSSQGPIGNSFGIVAFFKDWVGSFQTELLEPMPFSSWIKLSELQGSQASLDPLLLFMCMGHLLVNQQVTQRPSMLGSCDRFQRETYFKFSGFIQYLDWDWGAGGRGVVRGWSWEVCCDSLLSLYLLIILMVSLGFLLQWCTWPYHFMKVILPIKTRLNISGIDQLRDALA